jgi:hypothetical protein
MSFATHLVAPLVAMLSVPGAMHTVPEQMEPPARLTRDINELELTGETSVIAILAEGFRSDTASQVRIEQRMTIRISPRQQSQSDMLAALPAQAVAPRLVEKKIGKCLPAAGIVGVQADRDNRLLLFMRDRRIVSAALERACAARDFYSGFYLSRTADGRMCVDRDTLLSRSGANCKLTKLRQLVEAGE